MKDTKRLAAYGLIVAVIILMAFTPLGYIKTPMAEITLIVIPVAVGAIILGPSSGAVFGGVFGITSFIQCFGLSPFGAALLAVNPVLMFITCLIPRIITGFLCGYAFKLIKKRNPTPSVPLFGLAALVAPVCNTILFVSCVLLFFEKSEYITTMRNGADIITFLAAFIGLNGVIETVVTFIAGGAISFAVFKSFKQRGDLFDK